MAQFDEHIQQAKRNLQFLELINKSHPGFCDWQVTVCFYTALHFVNAHISNFGMQYRKHVDVKDAINPRNRNSLNSGSSLPDNEYLAYTKLQSLSRRSRYLVNEKDGNLSSTTASLTYEVHFKRALMHLNTVIKYISNQYKIDAEKITISCDGIGAGDLCFSK